MAKNFDSYWASLALKNPSLNDESGKMTISVASFKKQLQAAYKQGDADRTEMIKAARKLVGGIGGRDKYDAFLDGLLGR